MSSASRPSSRSRSLVHALWLAVAISPGIAAEPPQRFERAQRECDATEAERLTWLQRRLDESSGYARWWWRGWTGIYVGGMVFEGGRAGFEDDRGERANSIASAVKSTIGLGRAILSQPEAMRGAVDRQEVPSCREALARAEARLAESVEQARYERRSWIPHVVNFGLNAAAAVVVAEMYDEDSAWWSGALGFAVGEIRIWSYPSQAEDDQQAYRRSFGSEPRRDGPATWHLAPSRNGARLVMRF